MSNNHFSYFQVKIFKRFKDLEVKDIGQNNQDEWANFLKPYFS